jgi:uncharacterized protein YdhG (YjbR/CyaY superfamily)
MAKTAYTSVAQYIAAQPAASRPVLNQVRAAIRKALPDAEEVISYQIAAYRLPGGIALFFAGWKQHYSLYPAQAALVVAFAKELAPYEVNNKGTIRFPLDKPVPVTLIARIAKFRAKEIAAAVKAKKAAKKGARSSQE